MRSIATALIVAAGLTLGLLPAAAKAAGPGVTLFVNTAPRPIDVPGSRFAGGVSIRLLLQQIGVDLETVSFVTVTRVDGGLIKLTPADLAASSALITDDGTRTRFVRGRSEVSATADTGPLQINVNGGDIIVTASVDRNRIDAGESVTLSARVSFSPPGAQLSYEWDFNDGSAPRTGSTVRHVYDAPGPYQPRVTVSGAGGSTGRCASSCGGQDDVAVTVGDPPPPPTTTTQSPGSGTGDTQAPGSSAGTGVGGQGGSGGDASGTGTSQSTTPKPSVAKPKPKPPPPPPLNRPFGVPITGVLIDDSGESVRKLPSGTAAGAPKGQQQTRGGASVSGIEIPLGGLLALGVMSLGALRERRGVRLRLA